MALVVCLSVLVTSLSVFFAYLNLHLINLLQFILFAMFVSTSLFMHDLANMDLEDKPFLARGCYLGNTTNSFKS